MRQPHSLLCRGANFARLAALFLLLAPASSPAQTSVTDEGFVSLFDGKTLDGWKIGDNASLFTVHDGMIVMESPATNHAPAHLFYDGDVGGHRFKNFDLRVDVLTSPYANSGIYFHTAFQQSGWPKHGLECQVNNSHSDWRRTGSLYAIRNLSWGPETPPADNKEFVVLFPIAPVTDNNWYTQEIVCHNGFVTVKLNDKTVLEWQVPDSDTEHPLSSGAIWEPRGTFALQGHPPLPGHISKACFKNIRVKILPD